MPYKDFKTKNDKEIGEYYFGKESNLIKVASEVRPGVFSVAYGFNEKIALKNLKIKLARLK